MNITINPTYETLRPFIERIPELFNTQGKEIYHARNIIKVMETPNGLLLNVKRFHAPRFINKFVYSLGLRAPKGQRAYQYASILNGKGINTPEPIALIEDRNILNLLGFSYLITVQCNNAHTLYEVKDMTEEEYVPLARALAQFACRIHHAEILHKDFTPGNILWMKDDGDYHFSLVDINRMYFGNVDAKMGLRNLTRFWGPKAFTQILAEEYARSRRLDVDTSVDYVMKVRRKFWTRYQRKHEIYFTLEL